MARLVKAASVLFTKESYRGKSDARQVVLKQLHHELESLKGLGLNLVVFSEGVEAICQSMDEAESIDRPGEVLQAYQAFAQAERCTVAGSVKIDEGGKVYNSIAYIGPDGAILGVYHKTFLTHGELDRGMVPGPGATVVDTPAGRLGGAICFDLNFEELCQQYVPLKPDILTFASMYHGGLMQGIWAYRCRSYFISALPFHGGGLLDPFGRQMAITDCYSPVVVARLNLDRVMVHLDFNRQKFPEIRRKYGDRITLDIPPNVGSALITSQVDDLTAMDVVKDFELILLDDYFAMARRDNKAVAAGGVNQGVLQPA